MIQRNDADKKSAAEIEELILAEADFGRKVDIYAQHYSLVKSSGRLTTNGPLNTKFFCVCNNCQKEPNYNENLGVYNGYLEKELKQIISVLNGFTDYEQKLKFYSTNFDINYTYLFEDLGITMSIEPVNENENKVFNEFQYRCCLEKLSVNSGSESAPKNPSQLDFSSMRKAFIQKKQHSAYPDQSASKEIARLNKHFDEHWNSNVRELYQSLIDGISLDYTSAPWSLKQCLEIVEANEAVKFLKYLGGLDMANTSYTKSFHDAIQQSDEVYESYSVITWKVINGCIQEIKDKLYELSNDDSRIAYLKTTLLSFKIVGFEDYFKEVEAFLGDDIGVNTGFEAVGNVIRITNPEKYSPLMEGMASVIKGRDCIVLEISEHLIDVYPLINFNAIMEAVDYRTKSTFWISSAKFAKTKNVTTLTNREKAQLYLYQVDLGVEERLNAKEFNKKFSKNIEMHRNDIISKRKPSTAHELNNLLDYLKETKEFPEIQCRILKDLQSLGPY